MSNELQGLTVLVTRPHPAGARTSERILALGGQALHYPVLAFGPPPDQSAYLKAMAMLPTQAWLIFISPQAVIASLPQLLTLKSQLLPTVRVACVGEATAALLRAAGFQHVVCPDHDYSSEGLLALPALQTVEGVSIAVIRGVGGREKIDRVLSERKANVLPVIAYERHCPTPSAALQASIVAALREHRIDVMLGASFQSVEYLKQLLGEDLWPWVRDIPLVVMSERIQQLSKALGFLHVFVSDTASERGVLHTLVKERNRLCQMKQMRMSRQP